MKHKGIIITSGLIAVLLTVAGFTVFNKRWWKRMINKRWPIQFARSSESESGWAFRGWYPDMSRYSYAQLMRWYFKGDEGWFRTEEDYQAWARQRSTSTSGPGYETEVG